jgi:Domain of unknown function (DUF4190)
VSEGAWVVRPTVPRAASRRLVDAAAAEATAMRVPVTVAIVDESSVLKEPCLMDGLPQLAAIVLGIAALRQVRRTGERGTALAAAGLVIATLGLLLAHAPGALASQAKAVRSGPRSP